jgi:hypothetical protein
MCRPVALCCQGRTGKYIPSALLLLTWIAISDYLAIQATAVACFSVPIFNFNLVLFLQRYEFILINGF